MVLYEDVTTLRISVSARDSMSIWNRVYTTLTVLLQRSAERRVCNTYIKDFLDILPLSTQSAPFE